MKEVLIITYYFPPEMGAASNRMLHLCHGLHKRDLKVSVATPMPNYPKGRIFDDYRGKFSYRSNEGGITIHRLWLFASNSKNVFLRLFAMLSYSMSLVLFFLTNKVPKTVIVQCPPLLVAFTCMLFLKSRRRKLILNISDLWPLAGLELGVFKPGVNYRILERIERFNYRRADLVLGQSEEILNHVSQFVSGERLVLYRNYPKFKAPELVKSIPKNKIRLVYAGLLGVAQGVHRLCNELDYSKLEFHIYGSGSESGLIQAFVSDHPELPVFFHGEVSREQLHGILMEYDLTVIPLVNRIYGSVPSKIFEYALLGLPILYFGGGEGELIVREHNLGWVAESGNYENLRAQIQSIRPEDLSLDKKRQVRAAVRELFDFDVQLDGIANRF